MTPPAFPLRHLPGLCSLMPGFSSLCSGSAESQEKMSCECASSTIKYKILASLESKQKSTASLFHVDCSNIWADRVATVHEITAVVVSFSAYLGKGVGKTTSTLILKVSSFSQDSCMRRLRAKTPQLHFLPQDTASCLDHFTERNGGKVKCF